MTSPTSLLSLLALWAALTTVFGCSPPEQGLFPYCSDQGDGAISVPVTAPTYQQDIKPIVDGKCVRCHKVGGQGPFSLETYPDVIRRQAAALVAIESKQMPPWQAASCCAEYRRDFSLTAEERATFAAWVAAGAPEGDPAAGPARPTPDVGGLSRIDLTLTMPEPYTPSPPAHSTDDNRCFLLDWPFTDARYVTGLDVMPGNRAIVHHLIVAVLAPADQAKARERDRKDPGPGFDCNGGTGGIRVTTFIGGGLGASEPPPGYGTRVDPGAKILLNIHYSTAHVDGSVPSDRTSIALRIDATGKPLKTIVAANPAWLVGAAMKVRAGDPDAVFYFHYRPTLFTRGKRVKIWSAGPHMHTFGTRFLLGILRKDGSKDCLLEIPRWEFGWEQHYWLTEPKLLEPDDEIYVECRFDNSEARQPIVGGKRAQPRDIAWGGNNQDMCAGFVAFGEL